MQTFLGIIVFFCAVAAVVLFVVFIVQWIRKKPKKWIGLSSVFCLVGIFMFTIIGVSLPNSNYMSEERASLPNNNYTSEERASLPNNNYTSEERASLPNNNYTSEERAASLPNNNYTSEEKTVNKNVIDSIEMRDEEKILFFEHKFYSNKYFFSEGVISDLSEGLGNYSFTFYEKSENGLVNSPLSISKNNKNVNMKVINNGDCIKIHGFINDNKETKIFSMEKVDIGFTIEDIINDYKENCEKYDYESIARNPDQYKGKYAKFTGEVIQVLESGKNVELRVNVTKELYMYEDIIYVTYTRKSETESRILENDIVTIYGTLSGLKSYESIIGAPITIPQLDAKYINIKTE